MKKMMMLAAAWMLAAMFAFAEDGELVKVCGKGTGTDKTEALKDAYRDAVERAVGLYVDAEQMMKNEKLVTDQILTQSNAYIEKYEIASENKSANGLVTVNILAEVRKSALTKKLSDVMPTVTVDVSAASRNAHAQAVTEAKMRDDALALIKNELSGFDPIRQLMTVYEEGNRENGQDHYPNLSPGEQMLRAEQEIMVPAGPLRASLTGGMSRRLTA